MHRDLQRRIDVKQPRTHHIHFLLTDGAVQRKNLTVQIGRADRVMIDDRDCTDTGTYKRLGRKTEAVNTYRVDRMSGVKQVSRKRIPAPEDFKIQDYTDKVFWMYDGNEEEVTLRCRNKILDQVIDRFGEGIELKNVTRQTFDVTVPVCISGTFSAWVTQFVGEMTIVAPGNVKDAYAGYLQEAIDDVLGN